MRRLLSVDSGGWDTVDDASILRAWSELRRAASSDDPGQAPPVADVEEEEEEER